MAEAPRRAPVWQALLFIGVSVAVLVVVVRWLAGQGEFMQAVRGADWGALPLVLLATGAQLLLSTWRWQLILKGLDCAVSYRRTLGVVLACWPPAAVTPSRASDLLRAWMLRDVLDPFVGMGSVITEKAIDVLALSFLGSLGLVLAGLYFGAATQAGVGLAAAGVLALALFARPFLLGLLDASERLAGLRPKFEALFGALDALRRRPALFLLVFGTALASWSLAGTMLFLLLGMFGADVPAGFVLAFWPAAIFAGMLPLTLAGMGTRDAAFVLLLGTVVAVAEGPVLAATVGYALLGTWLWVLVGLPFMLRAGFR